MQYDYLPKSDGKSSSLRTQEAQKDAIRRLQVGVVPCQAAAASAATCIMHNFTICLAGIWQHSSDG